MRLKKMAEIAPGLAPELRAEMQKFEWHPRAPRREPVNSFGYISIKVRGRRFGEDTVIAAHEALCGYQVDDATRAVIQKAGFAEYFTHRTGHSIGVEVHGNGANMDNFENHDERRVSPFTCFSIEPGIYLPDFGVRNEINMYVGETDAVVTGEIQREIVFL